MTIDPILEHRLRTLSVRKVKRKLREYLIFFGYLLAFPMSYIVVTAYSKLKNRHYKFATLNFSSIGHALKVDAFARRVQNEKSHNEYIFISAYQKIINPYFYQLIERKFKIIKNPFLGFFLISLIKIPNALNFNALVKDLTIDELKKYSQVSWFIEEDYARGQELLKGLGIAINGWYVCFFARDNAYNENFNYGDERDYNLTYHSVRNSDIATYELAINFILNKGGCVIRMGMIAEKPLNIRHPNLIDYPYSSFKSDFADIYLMCHAKFVVGCPSGIVDVSSINNVPLGAVNSCIPWLGHQRKHVIFVPKLFQYIKSKKYLSLNEHAKIFQSVDNSIVFNGLMRQHGLRLIDNSEDEILLVVQKMYEYFIESEKGFELLLGEDNKIMPEFLALFPDLISDLY